MAEQQIVLTCRRVVLLSSASAVINPLARAWGVCIHGRIGHHGYACLEAYSTRDDARKRAKGINRYRRAMVASIEVTLFPTGYSTFKYVPKDIVALEGNIGFR